MVPRLPGSCRPARTTISGAAFSGRPRQVLPGPVRRLNQGGDRLGRLGGQRGVQQLSGQQQDLGLRRQRQAFEQMLRLPAPTKTQSTAQAGAQRLFEQVRPFDAGQRRRRLAAGAGRAPGAAPSGGNSAYSVQCEQASDREPSCSLADSKPFGRGERQRRNAANLHRGWCCDSFRLYGISCYTLKLEPR